MPNKEASKSKRRKRDTTVRDIVAGRIELTYELDGLEAARKEFDQMKLMFSDLTPEWSDIADEVLAFFREKKKMAQEEAGEREQQATQMLAEALRNGIVTNQLNLMLGSNAQGVYYPFLPPKKGDHES